MGLEITREEGKIAAWCKRWKVSELSLDAAAAGHDSSELDVRIEFEPNVHMGLLGLARLSSDLEAVLGQPVAHLEERSH